MEETHHLPTIMDSKMDMTDEEVKMETVGGDFSAGAPDETHQHPANEGPSCSHRKIAGSFRPRLKSTKSFPPYSQCIGGIGEDSDKCDNVPDSQLSSVHHASFRNEVGQSTKRKEDFKKNARCGDMKAKWKTRRGRLGRSWEIDSSRWEREENSVREREHDDKDRDGGTNIEWKHYRVRNSSMDREKKEDEERMRGILSAVEGENDGGDGTPKDEEAEEILGIREGPTAQESPSPHPILSKILQSSSTSSCSSINLSSGESDDVFSEGEDAERKKRMFKKCRSWKTFLTMMHWSLRQQSSWVQLAGHQGNFMVSDKGEVLKLYSEVEAKCLESLMRDPLRPFVPQYHGVVTRGDHCYIRLEDLLSGLRRPVIMDCKMGVRTFQEEELIKAKVKNLVRSDMYQKMVKIDPSAPSAEEHAQMGVTKSRYLQWRDATSSTSLLGFRIEGLMMEDGSVQRDFRNTLTLAQVTEALLYFTRSQLDILKAYHSRLLALSDALKNSLFFRTHEVIGSSLLFVHDHNRKANVWMIDFGKTTPVSNKRELQHNVPWTEGSREDGYLIGLTSLITALSQAIDMACRQQEDCTEEERIVT